MTKRVVCMLFSLLAAGASSAWGQKWEFGGAAGLGFYTSTNLKNSTAGNAGAKIGPGLSAAVWLGNNTLDTWGGELRYDYQRGDLKLNSGSGSASFASQTHTFHYDVHLQFGNRETPIRPFVAFGAGVKMYQGTGQETASQALSRIALLTKTNDVRPVASVGAGVKARVGERWHFRAGVWDFISPFPAKVIAPNTNTTAGGWFHDFTPMVGVSYLF